MKKIGFMVLSVAFLLGAQSVRADIIIDPPPPPPLPCEQEEYKNHGQYVSCVAHEKELRGPGPGNSTAAQSTVGQE